jgi:hypothetical protein
VNALQQAARGYYRRGWTPIPLGLDGKGDPKLPLGPEWQKTQHTVKSVMARPWASAVGVGNVLGPASGNLAVIDVDDEQLAREVFAAVLCLREETFMVWTCHSRLHVYVQEQRPSSKSKLWYEYEGRRVAVELLAQGQQAAAPPTPGYSVANETAENGGTPWPDMSVRACWGRIVGLIGESLTFAPEEAQAAAGGGYPKPWRPTVGAGERNDSAYVEAHRLREAGMPLDEALDVMRARLASYEPGGLEWAEVERTVRSAYSKGEVQRGGRRPWTGISAGVTLG